MEQHRGSVTTINSEEEEEEGVEGEAGDGGQPASQQTINSLVVDRTRSLPLARGSALKRRTAPADLAAMMQAWKLSQEGQAAQLEAARDKLGEEQRLSAAAASSSSSTGTGQQQGAGSSSDEDDSADARQRRRQQEEEGRRKSWARGEATMNHAEVRLMMEMMRQAKRAGQEVKQR